jgi:uncharacterized protein
MYNVHIRFEWDENKERENLKKHGVTFEEAATIFFGQYFEVFYDPKHSNDEVRYIAIGFSDKGKPLLVVHSENKAGTKIRIISARVATRKEQLSAFGKKL